MKQKKLLQSPLFFILVFFVFLLSFLCTSDDIEVEEDFLGCISYGDIIKSTLYKDKITINNLTTNDIQTFPITRVDDYFTYTMDNTEYRGYALVEDFLFYGLHYRNQDDIAISVPQNDETWTIDTLANTTFHIFAPKDRLIGELSVQSDLAVDLILNDNADNQYSYSGSISDLLDGTISLEVQGNEGTINGIGVCLNNDIIIIDKGEGEGTLYGLSFDNSLTADEIAGSYSVGSLQLLENDGTYVSKYTEGTVEIINNQIDMRINGIINDNQEYYQIKNGLFFAEYGNELVYVQFLPGKLCIILSLPVEGKKNHFFAFGKITS